MSSRKKGVVGRLLECISHRGKEKVVAELAQQEKGEKKMSKKLLVGLVGLLLLASGIAQAATHIENLTLTVRVTPTLSVNVPSATYAFGTLNSNTASVAAESTAVINDSTDATQKYNLRASDAKGDVDWTLGTAAGTDAYTLHVQFNSTRPGDFGSGDDDYNLTNADQTATATVFAGDEDGDNVAAGVEILLWFRINTPTSVGSTDVKTIYVTITALNQG